MTAHPQRLSELLRRALERSPLSAGVQRQAALGCWSELVGAEIARHSRAVSLNEGTLLVHVDGSVWAQELALLRPRILAGFAARFGETEVRDIRFHTGHDLS